ncbi:hypothetical protein IQ250_25600, partial [Pseudanabaenaceae cyanobacterium LEGE 13415]|nr:hypothetical protein [Pseudanabaenaceae cyanobacterium LEGE 13415]
MMRKQIGFGILAALMTMISWVTPAFAQTSPPLESQLQPKAQITLTGNRVNVKLINLT